MRGRPTPGKMVGGGDVPMGKDLRTAKLATRLRLGLGKRHAANRLVKAKAARKSWGEGLDGPAAEPDRPTQPTADPGTGVGNTIPQRPHFGYDTERAAYFRRKPELLRTIPGKFVVFVGEEMVGPFADFPSAIGAGLQRFGRGPLYIKQILIEEPYIEIGTVVDPPCRS